MKTLTDTQREVLTDLFHQASVIQQQVVNCLDNQRVGREWQLKIEHCHERITQLLPRLKP